MAGWSISASACRSDSKPRHHIVRVHADLDQFDADTAADRLLLLGQPHLTHAALADKLEQMIGTDDGSPAASLDAMVRVANTFSAPGSPGSFDPDRSADMADHASLRDEYDQSSSIGSDLA